MTGSRTPIREHALIQPRITESLNPAPSHGEPTDRPTRGNQVAGPDQTPAAIKNLGRGFQSIRKDESIDQLDREGTFGDSWNVVNLDLGGGTGPPIATHSMSEEESVGLKYECADGGAVECEESMETTAAYIQNVSQGLNAR